MISGDYFAELVLILDNDFLLVLYGLSEYMEVVQLPKDDFVP